MCLDGETVCLDKCHESQVCVSIFVSLVQICSGVMQMAECSIEKHPYTSLRS